MKLLISLLLLVFLSFFNIVKSENLIKISTEFKQSYKCLISSDQYVYVASDLGLYKFNGQNLFKVREINTAVYELYEDKLKTIWIIDSKGEIYCKLKNGKNFIKISADFESRFIFSKIIYENDTSLFVRMNKKLNKGLILDSFANVNKKTLKTDVIKCLISGKTPVFLNKKYTFQTFYKKRVIYSDWIDHEILIYDSSNNKLLKEIKFGDLQINNISLMNNRLLFIFDHGIFSFNDSDFTFKILFDIEHPTCIRSNSKGTYISSLMGFYKSTNKQYDIVQWSYNKFVNSVYFNSENDFYYIDKSYNLFHSINSKQFLLSENASSRYSYYNELFCYGDFINFNRSIYNLKENRTIQMRGFVSLYDTVSFKDKVKFIGSGYLNSFLIDDKLKENKLISYGENIYDIKNTGNYIAFATNKGLFFSNRENIAKIEANELERGIQNIDEYKNILIGKTIIDLEKIDKDFLGVLAENNEFFVFNNRKMMLNVRLTLMNDFLFKQVKLLNDSTFAFACPQGILLYRYLKGVSNETEKNRKIGFYPLTFHDQENSQINSISVYSGKLWISTSEGLYSFNYESKPVILKPEFILIDVVTNSTKSSSIAENFNNEMDVFANALVFNFDIINYNPIISADKQIRYRLIANKKDTSVWQYASSNLISLISLNKGSYQLQIESINNQLDWKIIKNYYFYIPVQYFETSLFKVLMVVVIFLILALTVYYVIDYRRKKLQNENYQLQNENIELKFLKTQMNPHFVFNALNSLKSLVFLKENSKAEHYIDNLAVFFRSILDQDEKIEIGLADELKNCESYIALENIRLNNLIKLNIEIEIDLAKIRLPANILQPIIENTIKHGFDFAQLPGIIEVSVSLRSFRRWYQLEITDNGRGLKEQIGSKESFALKLIQKRLDRFNRNKITNCLVIANKYDENNKIKGVSCTIMLIKK